MAASPAVSPAVSPAIAGPGAGARPELSLRTLRVPALLLLVLAATWLPLHALSASHLVPVAWPASGLVAGLYLTSPNRTRRLALGAVFAIVLGVRLGTGSSALAAVGFALSCTAEPWLVRRALMRGPNPRRVALLDQGDVSRMVRAIVVGAGGAAAIAALAAHLTGASALLVAIAVFATHAAWMMVVLPLFVKTLRFAPLARTPERVVQWIIAVGTTYALFSFAQAPPLVFAVMPMFGWLAFRGTLREATLVLGAVTVVGSTLTALSIGPVASLAGHYHLPQEIVVAILSLFWVDCGLIMLPLSVMVTQQRMASERESAGRETLERLVASATGTAIIATDGDGRITVFNPGAEAMLGYHADEVVGGSPDRFHSYAELDQVARALGARSTYADVCRAVVATGDPQRLWRLRRRDGADLKVLMSIASLRDAHGEPAGFLATAEDVTEREAAHEALLTALEQQRTATDRLRELDQAKTDLVATVSHELRTPITSIIGYVELLNDGLVGDLSPEQRDLVARVQRNSRRLHLLIEDLLTLSHLEEGDLRIDPVLTNLNTVVTESLEALAPMLSNRQLSIASDLPQTPLMHEGDPVQLGRLVSNLLTNAVKFTPDGGVVSVQIHPDDTCTHLEVSDSGIGIPPEEQPQLGNRFYRGAAALKQEIQGAGLGLAIVKAVATAHSGHVDIASAVGTGTKVTVTLPRVIPRSRAARHNAQRSRKSAAASGTDHGANLTG